MITERIALASLTLSTAAAGLSFFNHERRRLTARFHAAHVRSQKLAIEGGEQRFWLGPRGPKHPLLFVHGFGGDALMGWARQAALANDRLVVAPDLLWFGDSFDGSKDFSAAHQAATILHLLDHLDIDVIDVVGISYGGFVTLELLQQAPHRFRRVALADCPGHAYTLTDYREMLDRLNLDSIADLVVPADPSGVRDLMRIAYRYPPPIPMFVARDVYAKMFVQHRAEKVRLLDFLLHLAATVDPDTYRCEHETLVLWGSHDRLFPPHLAQRLANTLGVRARVELIHGTNHAPNMERPLRFNRVLRDFLDHE